MGRSEPHSNRSGLDAWRDAFHDTWQALKREGRDPRSVFASWADIKPSTAYAWKNGKCDPGLDAVLRLSRAACKAGYYQMPSLFVDDGHRIVGVEDEVRVTGTLTDNIRDLDAIENRIWGAAETGDVEGLKEAANDLHQEADEIAAEATTNFNE